MGDMRIGNIHPAVGGESKPRKRRGKGSATGLAARRARDTRVRRRGGRKIPAWFEGGQMPIQRRIPKRGFKNPGRVEYQVVAVGRLASAAANTTVDRAWLRQAGIISRSGRSSCSRRAK